MTFSPHRGELRIWSMLGIVLLTLAACSGSEQTVRTADSSAPDWVRKGLTAFPSDDGNLFYGVGSCERYKSLPLARNVAASRARAQIAAVLRTQIVSRLETSLTVSSSSKTSEEQIQRQAEHLLNTYSQAELSGVTVQYWRDPQSKAVYALAGLDMTHFRRYLEHAMEENHHRNSP